MKLSELRDYLHPSRSICLEKDVLPAAGPLCRKVEELTLDDVQTEDYRSFCEEFGRRAPESEQELQALKDSLIIGPHFDEAKVSTYLAAFRSPEVEYERSYNDGIYTFRYRGRFQSAGYLAVRHLEALGVIRTLNGWREEQYDFLDFLPDDELEKARFWFSQLAVCGDEERLAGHLKAYRALACAYAAPRYRALLNLDEGLLSWEELARCSDFTLRQARGELGLELFAYALAGEDEEAMAIRSKFREEEQESLDEKIAEVTKYAWERKQAEVVEARLRLRAYASFWLSFCGRDLADEEERDEIIRGARSA